MNAPNQDHNHIQPNDLADRLVDTALAELVGGAAPPDLSARIAAATSRQPAAPASAAAITQPPRTRRNRAFWASLAIAATLLIGVTFTLVSHLHSKREGALVVAELAKQLQNHHDASRPFPAASADRLGSAAKPAQQIHSLNRLGQSSPATPTTPLATSAQPAGDAAKPADFD